MEKIMWSFSSSLLKERIIKWLLVLFFFAFEIGWPLDCLFLFIIKNLVLFYPHTLQLLLDLITFQLYFVVLGFLWLIALINSQYYS